MANDVLGAQAHFSTNQKLFSSSSDKKKQTVVFRNVYMQFTFKQICFLWEARTPTPDNTAKYLLQMQLSCWAARDDSARLIDEFSRGTQLQNLFILSWDAVTKLVHQSKYQTCLRQNGIGH